MVPCELFVVYQHVNWKYIRSLDIHFYRLYRLDKNVWRFWDKSGRTWDIPCYSSSIILHESETRLIYIIYPRVITKTSKFEYHAHHLTYIIGSNLECIKDFKSRVLTGKELIHIIAGLKPLITMILRKTKEKLR